MIKKWEYSNPDLAGKYKYKYNNSERGFLINTISRIFVPFDIKKRNLVPLITKKEIWEELILYVQKMKELFPYSDGRLCEYCKKPWTYIRHQEGCIIGQGRRNLSFKPVNTNFSIDRLDNNLTYTKQNIVFCCGSCNHIKNSVTFDMCKKILKIKDERNL
mgnify:CR=1 FL=1|jgi:hypothetical protein|tara:strand:- start:854 stop:1333 length:480 start_codon:yes stop_codon:yes gene_type:complete